MEKDVILGLDWEKAAPKGNIVEGDELYKFAKKLIVKNCSKAFRTKDIVLYVFLTKPFDSYDHGIVFTEKGLFYYEYSTNTATTFFSIHYGDIVNLDYDFYGITIGDFAIKSGSFFPAYMYNLILSITEAEKQ